MKRVAVSGGFDPIHIGHIRLFKQAKMLGDELIVILNNDNWLMDKKGFVFMSQDERREILLALRDVDGVVITDHQPGDTDRSVTNVLAAIRPAIFANGGDRKLDNIPETGVCEEYGIEMLFNLGEGGKVQSSSWLTDKVKNNEVQGN